MSNKKGATEQCLLVVKPVFNTAPVIEFIVSRLRSLRVKITYQGKLHGQQIAFRKLFDSHFASFISHAEVVLPGSIILLPSELEAFYEKFYIEWHDLVDSGQLCNYRQACEYLGVDGAELGRMSSRSSIVHRLRSGLHVALLDATCTDSLPLQERLQSPVYVINGFYAALRESYSRKRALVTVFSLEWESAAMSWTDFADNVVGCRDPGQAPPTSIRGNVFQSWQQMQLKNAPDMHSNCVHVSHSAFEGLAERLLWVKGAMVFTDPMGARLMAANITAQLVQTWLLNPTVAGERTVFQHMDGLDALSCVAKAQELFGEANCPPRCDFSVTHSYHHFCRGCCSQQSQQTVGQGRTAESGPVCRASQR